MRVDLAEEMSASPAHCSLLVDGEMWRVYIFGVSRLPDSWMLQLALFGSSIRTVVVHVSARRGAEAATRDVITLLRDWLRSGDPSTHRFLEMPDHQPRPAM